jgi:hypothetical protein
MEPLVLGIFLKVETRGFPGPAPKLPREPVRSESGPEGYQLFVYDLTPKDEGLAVSDAAQRIASRIGRLFAPERLPFPEGHYALRLSLEIGLLADASAGAISYSWPLDFLQAIADAGIELNVSHYLPSSEADDADADDEY